MAMCLVVGIAAAAADAQGPRGSKSAQRRSRPPASWDAATAETFLPDAFSTLSGARPAFTGGGPPVPAVAGAGTATTPAGTAQAGGFRWSMLVSEDSLTDEIKEAKAAVAAACAKPTDFKGGGFDQARVAFSTLALAFGVIAEYDQDIRWKKDAATARDLFARAGVNCKTGTDQSFAESKARLEDLEAMLDGSPPKGKPDRDEDFAWSQVAGRPALMKRLEAAEAALRPAIADSAGFKGGLDELRHAVEIVAAIGEAIQRPDFEYHDDDTYRGYAAAMRDAASEARAAAEKKDFEAARAAVGRLEKACNDCHGDYRS